MYIYQLLEQTDVSSVYSWNNSSPSAANIQLYCSVHLLPLHGSLLLIVKTDRYFLDFTGIVCLSTNHKFVSMMMNCYTICTSMHHNHFAVELIIKWLWRMPKNRKRGSMCKTSHQVPCKWIQLTLRYFILFSSYCTKKLLYCVVKKKNENTLKYFSHYCQLHKKNRGFYNF